MNFIPTNKVLGETINKHMDKIKKMNTKQKKDWLEATHVFKHHVPKQIEEVKNDITNKIGVNKTAIKRVSIIDKEK